MLTADRQRGLALIAVLWGLVLLSVIAMSVVTTTRTEALLARNVAENAEAKALADAGVERAILDLRGSVVRGTLGAQRDDPMKPGEGAAALSGGREAEAEGSPAEPGYGAAAALPPDGMRVDGSVYSWRVRGGEVLISAQDEGGKIDLNRSPDGIIRGLFAAVGVAEDEAAALTDSIVDYRDTNNARRLNGAEDSDYRAAGRQYGAKDRPFESTDELLQVLGMTTEVYELVAPALTVHSRRRRVNRDTAPPLVLAALLGLDVEELTAREAEEPAVEEALSSGRSLPQLRPSATGLARSRIGVFTIRAEARANSGAVFVREAVINLKGDPGHLYRVLEWRRGRLRAPGGGAGPEGEGG